MLDCRVGSDTTTLSCTERTGDAHENEPGMTGGAIQLLGPLTGRAAWARNRRSSSPLPQPDEDESLPLFHLPETRAATTANQSQGDHLQQSISGDDDDDEGAHDRPLLSATSNAGISRAQIQHWVHCFSIRRRWLSPRKWIFLGIILTLGAFIGSFFKTEADINALWIPDQESLLFSKRPLPPPLERTQITSFQLPLRTKGRHVVDGNGRRFKLSSINWYGASDEAFVPGGLDIQHRGVIAQTIKKLGFNSVRLPYADELVTLNPIVDSRLLKANPDLVGLSAFDILEKVTTTLTDEGIAVIINNHITKATWCCGANPCDAGWANDDLPFFYGGDSFCSIKQTEEQWIENWETVMKRFTSNSLVIGVDLRNEVRGLWGTMPWSKWADAAEKCGNRLLKMNNDWLVVVEGTESANDLSGARTRPIVLDVTDRLVYSAHVYAWSGWGSLGGRFSKRSYSSFAESMRSHWAYLLEGDVAPVWVGELGAPNTPSVGDAHYWQNLWRFLKSVDADFGYWALNPRKAKGNTSESYSLVGDDWVTPVLDYRMKDMVELMRA